MNSGISVAICTYNGARFVAEQLTTIAEHSLLPDEIVISDDGSTDGTLQIIEQVWASLTAEHPEVSAIKIKIVQNDKPLGVVANFYQALNSCNSEFIALCDQDDIWEPSKLQTLRETFRTHPGTLLVFSDTQLVGADGVSSSTTGFEALGVSRRELRLLEDGKTLDVLLRRNVVTGAATMIRSDLLRFAGEFPDTWVHDEWLAITASLLGGVAFVNKPLTRYRQHGGNQIGLSKNSFRSNVGRLVFPGRERNEKLYSRAQTLLDIAESLEVSTNVIAKVSDKFHHERVRSSFSTHRPARLKPIWGEILNQRYFKFGLGAKDIIRDLVQPLKQ